MKILIVNTLYAPFQVGGAEVSVRTMAEELVKAGHKVYVLTLGYTQSVRKMNGVIVISIKTKNLYHIEQAVGQPAIKKLIWHLLDSFNPLYRTAIGNLLDRIQPDVVNTNNIQGFSPYIWKIIKSRNIKLVHTLRDYYLLCHTATMYTKCGDCQQLCMACKITCQIKKNFFSLPDGFVGISNFILAQHDRYKVVKKTPVRVIANGLNTDRYPEPLIKNPVKEVIFGFIGKVNQQKGVDFLFKELAGIQSDMSFKLVLAGKVEPEFEAEMTELYKGKFDFTFIGKTDPLQFYRLVDVVVVPSNWNEPFGRVPIEAVAACTPVCLADKAGLSELYNEQYMWQFEMQENSLKTLISSILSHPELISEKSAACAGIPNAYAPEVLNAQLIEFLKES